MGSRTSTRTSYHSSYWQKPIPGTLEREHKWWRWLDQLRRHQPWNHSRLLNKRKVLQHLQAKKILQETQEASHSRNPQVNCSNWTRQSSRPQYWFAPVELTWQSRVHSWCFNCRSELTMEEGIANKVSIGCFYYSLCHECLLWMYRKLYWSPTVPCEDCYSHNCRACTCYFGLPPAWARQ